MAFSRYFERLKETFTFGLMCADTTSDWYTAYLYYNNGDPVWFGLCLFFILFPSILSNTTLAWRFWSSCEERLKISKPVLVFLAATQLLTFWGCIMSIRDSFKDENERDKLLSEWSKFIKLLENISESFPQLALQSYVICRMQMIGISIGENGFYFPYISLAMSLLSLCFGFVTFTFWDTAWYYQVFFKLLSLLSSGIRLTVCVILGAGVPAHLWITIFSAYGTSVLVCSIYLCCFLDGWKYKSHKFLAFTCLNTTLFNTINTSGLFLNMVYIICFGTMWNVAELNAFGNFMHAVWYGCGMLLGINIACLMPFPITKQWRELWFNKWIF